MEIIPIVIAGTGAMLLYNSFYRQPEPTPEPNTGTSLPPPRFLYSEPRLWVSSPVDIHYLPSQRFIGPNNDPKIRYTLFGGSRVNHSGFNSVSRTNMVWESPPTRQPSGRKPGYNYEPQLGIGVPPVAGPETVLRK